MQLSNEKLTTAVPIFLLIGSLAVGCLIPAFYVWTDSDQSRPSPLLWQVPLAASGTSVVFCIVLPWLLIRRSEVENEPASNQFGIRRILFYTAVVAIAIAAVINAPVIVTALVGLVSAACLGAMVVQSPASRLAVCSLIACMHFPFAWLIFNLSQREFGYANLLMLFGLPALVPSSILARLGGEHPDQARWLFFLLSSIELLIGLWIITLGPRRTIAYLLLVLNMSAIGSLVLHQLILA